VFIVNFEENVHESWRILLKLIAYFNVVLFFWIFVKKILKFGEIKTLVLLQIINPTLQHMKCFSVSSYRRYRLIRSNFCPLCMLWTVLEMRINSLWTEAVFISCKASCLRYFIEELAFRDPNKSLSIISLEGWTNPRGSSVESSVRQQTLGIASIRRDAKKRRDALHSLKKFTKFFDDWSIETEKKTAIRNGPSRPTCHLDRLAIGRINTASRVARYAANSICIN